MRSSVVSLVLLALSAVVSSVSGNVVIFDDYTTGQLTLFSQANSVSFTDAQFNTLTKNYALPNSNNVGFQPTLHAFNNITIGLAWANDIDDSITFNYAVNSHTLAALPLTFTPFGPYAANCSVIGSGFGFQLFQAVPYCNLTISWTTSFVGNLAIAYQNQSQSGGQTESIVLEFVNTTQAVTVGDPQFVGLRGQSYQVHGIDGAVYNLITESNTQVNSRFVFLTSGECPVIGGRLASVGCWSHPGSYMGDMSFQMVVDGKLHAALVTAGSAKSGFASVQMDGKALRLGDSVSYGSFSLSYNSTHGVHVTLDNYLVELSNSDMFLNLALTAKVPLSQLKSHGLIGQTHSTKTHKTSIKYLEGDVDDYIVAEDDVFGNNFPFNQFQME